MNILVIGKAKTGTTIISKTIQHSINKENEYHHEPKNIMFFERKIFSEKIKSHVVKIIFEHWNSKPRMRNAICHNEATLKFNKIVCIKRDFLDEIVSRFMYILRPYSKKKEISDIQLQLWIDLLREKETNPSSISFLNMIKKMHEIFKIDFIANINSCIRYSCEYANFIKTNNKIIHTVQYENFIKGETAQLEEYLEFPLNNIRNVGELSHTTRSKTYNNWKTFFTEEDVEYFRKIISNNTAVRQSEDWELTPCENLPSEYFSEYVKRIIYRSPLKKA
jgi:hypothetical protein